MSQKRITAIYFFIMLSFSFLTLRLYVLSSGNKSTEALSGQYTRRLDIVQRSGFVYDRNAHLISHNTSSVCITIVPSLITKSISTVAEALSVTCKIPVSSVYSLLFEEKVFTLRADYNADLSSLKDISGIYTFYEYEEKCSSAVHLMGYKNADGQAVCGLLRDMQESLDVLSGRIYARFDANAVSKSMTDSIFEIFDDGYTRTDGIVLTIDNKLQHFTDNLENHYIDMGAIVITDINTGDILASSSYPSFDPQNVAKSLESDRGELINRVTSLFTPGSVFKLVVAAAALESNSALYDFSYTCTGSIKVGNEIFRCHNTNGHGPQTLSEAFSNSCNTYFIELGKKVGCKNLLETAKSFGLGKPVFADTLVSPAANIPDNAKNCPETLMANISFGQGTLLLSPLDLVNVTNACGTGFLPTLSVIKGTLKNDVLNNTDKKEPVRVLSDETCEKLKVMMKKCVQEGTGQKAFVKGVNSGGKTATAQTGQKDKNGKEILHTWFCGIYPVSSPKYSIIILCDGNGRNNFSPAEIFGIVNKHLVNCGY